MHARYLIWLLGYGSLAFGCRSPSHAAPPLRNAPARPEPLLVDPAGWASSCRTSPFAEAWRAGPDGSRLLDAARDVDGDSLADRVRAEESSGSGAGTRSGTVTLSRTGAEVSFEAEVAFDRMASPTAIPADLLAHGQEALRNLVEDALFDRVCADPDPTLAWLLSRDKKLSWIGGAPSLPDGNYALSSTERSVVQSVREDGVSSGGVWLDVLALNQQRDDDLGLSRQKPTVADRDADRVLLLAAHGAIVFEPRRNRHAWIYVHEGGTKLRFPSVQSGRLAGNDAVLRVSGGEDDVEIRIDLTSGAIAETPAPSLGGPGSMRLSAPAAQPRRSPNPPDPTR